MRNYMKKKKRVDLENLTADEVIANTLGRNNRLRKRAAFGICFLCIAIPLVCAGLSFNRLHNMMPESDGLVAMASTPIAAASSKKGLITIPGGTVNPNPFLPYKDLSGNSVKDVPKFDLVEPPDMVNEASEAARLMDTVVSGILYDKYSPSAILNIEGNDYLVKKGDVINNYKVMEIMQDSVTVKLGTNVYKAGIGEILTEATVNYNEASNLSKKFGGER